MKADSRFVGQPKYFWAHVRILSESLGYTTRAVKKNKVIVEPSKVRMISIVEIVATLERAGQHTDHVYSDTGGITPFGQLLVDYFDHRARVLNDFVRDSLMDVDEARSLYGKVRDTYNRSDLGMPMNKQKKEKKAIAYLTAMVNILVDANRGRFPCDFDPRGLTAITRNGIPLRTFARRLDGAFPSKVNPVAIWEIKEYYYTTTFGSRVADGVYETLLDGMEIEELKVTESIHPLHYLVVDSRYTWWVKGRSYLCRLIDMLHMGYVDEVIFGREVEEAIPRLVRLWVANAEQLGIQASDVETTPLGIDGDDRGAS